VAVCVLAASAFAGLLILRRVPEGTSPAATPP